MKTRWLPMGWRIAKIGELLSAIEAGKSLDGLKRPADPTEVGVLKLSAVSSGTFRPSENKALPPGVQTAGVPRIRKGDLLISRANTTELVGAVAIADDDYPNLMLSDKTLCLVPIEGIDRFFLARALRTADARHQLESRATGTSGSMRNITQETILATTIPLPPLPEQRRIAAILDQADALRAKRREAIGKLETLVRSCFLDLFGNPVFNPERWPTMKFSDVGELDRGVSKHRPRNAPELLGGPYPLIQTGDVSNCERYIRSYTSTYSEVGLRQSRMWPAGTLCITIAANIAKTGILTFEACFPDSVVGFKANELVTVEYVQIWLSFLQASLEASAPESAQKNINLAILRDLDLPVPPIALQQEFAKQVAAIDRLKVAHQAALAKLDELFASLQHRAFRGELTAGMAEQALAEGQALSAGTAL